MFVKIIDSLLTSLFYIFQKNLKYKSYWIIFFISRTISFTKSDTEKSSTDKKCQPKYIYHAKIYVIGDENRFCFFEFAC